MKSSILKIGAIGSLIVLVILTRYTGLTEYLSFEYINEHKELISEFIEQYYWLSVLLFIVTNVVCVSLALPVSVIFNVAAGYFFGLLPGVVYSNIGSTVGVLISFSICRYIFKDAMMARYGNRLAAFNKRFAKGGIGYLLFLQMLPITPYALIIVLGALSDIPALMFASTTFLGITPAALIYAYAGKEFGEITSAGDILSWPVIIALGLLASLALLPSVIGYLQKKRRHVYEKTI